VFRRLFDDGVTARAAKDAIDMLAARDWTICPVPGDTDMGRLAADLLALDVEVQLRRPEQDETGPWIAAVRERHKLSQRDFADRLGLDVRTLQNWEQGRNRPDSAVLSLIRLFDRDPALVLSAVFEPVV
jgi:putative transcriptional regulator